MMQQVDCYLICWELQGSLRQKEGILKARKNDVSFGRKRKMTEEDIIPLTSVFFMTFGSYLYFKPALKNSFSSRVNSFWEEGIYICVRQS